MDKEQLIEVLQTCLWYFDGMPREEMEKAMDSKSVKIGIKLCDYLKSINLEKQNA